MKKKERKMKREGRWKNKKEREILHSIQRKFLAFLVTSWRISASWASTILPFLILKLQAPTSERKTYGKVSFTRTYFSYENYFYLWKTRKQKREIKSFHFDEFVSIFQAYWKHSFSENNHTFLKSKKNYFVYSSEKINTYSSWTDINQAYR